VELPSMLFRFRIGHRLVRIVRLTYVRN
jgi:hypothetical protein